MGVLRLRPYSTYGTYSMELGESGGSAAWGAQSMPAPFVCTVLRHKMIFFQGGHTHPPWKNSSFCTVLRNKMLLLKGLYQYRPWANSFCTVLHGFPMPAPLI